MNYDYAAQDERHFRKHTGGMGSIADIRRVVYDDGKSRGVRAAEIKNGSGLVFSVLEGRGMDIGSASWRGIPLSFETPNGFCHPSYFEPEKLGWLRNWGGGLLTGCGMRSAGAPCEFEGEEFGLHGRLSNIPAENVSLFKGWRNGRYVLEISGEVRESRMFGENLLLKRKISTALGDESLTVEDTVENQGPRIAPLMLLYHINIGFPMLSEAAFLRAVKHRVTPRDERAKEDLETWEKAGAPALNFREQCYYHSIPDNIDGFSEITLVNPSLGIELSVSYRKDELPNLIQWRQSGACGEYALGLEPANCLPEGIAAESGRATLRHIKPGETVRTTVKIRLAEIAK
jgi:galactose mutarotase-like enzyme